MADEELQSGIDRPHGPIQPNIDVYRCEGLEWAVECIPKRPLRLDT